MSDSIPFEEDRESERPDSGFVLDLEGFGGPIDLLLELARNQKVDLTRISILALADQYLEFIKQARDLRLEVAADYLVMAAWLAYLKSRLLLPEVEEGDEPSGAEMAAALKFQLQRLQAMREAGSRVLALPQLGREFFARGAPEPLRVVATPVYHVSLYELLQGYARHAVRIEAHSLRINRLNYYSVDAALQRLRGLIGSTPSWCSLLTFLPPDLQDQSMRRSALASTLAASLEMARQGTVQIRQEGTFGPIYLRGLSAVSS